MRACFGSLFPTFFKTAKDLFAGEILCRSGCARSVEPAPSFLAALPARDCTGSTQLHGVNAALLTWREVSRVRR